MAPLRATNKQKKGKKYKFNKNINHQKFMRHKMR